MSWAYDQDFEERHPPKPKGADGANPDAVDPWTGRVRPESSKVNPPPRPPLDARPEDFWSAGLDITERPPLDRLR